MFASDSDFDEDFLDTILSCEASRINSLAEINSLSDLNSSQNHTTSESEKDSFAHRNDKASGSRFQDVSNEIRGSSIVIQKSTPLKTVLLEAPNFIRSVERKFPGPAGLLPSKENAVPIGDSTFSPEGESCVGHSDRMRCNKEQLTLQNWQTMVESETWKRLVVDLEHHFSGEEFLKTINIRRIKEKASARLLVTQKIPFLAVILQDLSSSSSLDPYVTLCDETGMINGTLHRDVWKQFGEELVTSCVLLLRNVGVFSIGVKSYKSQHYLNITSNNIVSLYTLDGDNVRLTSVNPFSSEEIARSIQEWHSLTIAPSKPCKSSCQSPQQLFTSTMSCHPCRNPQFSSPLSTKTNLMKGNRVNYSSPVTSKQQVSAPLSNHDAKRVCKYPNNIPCHQSSHRDSSAILNLISNVSDSSVSELSSLKKNPSTTQKILQSTKKSDEVNNDNNSCTTSLKVTNHNFSKKLSKFRFNCPKSKNSKEISKQDIINLQNGINSENNLILNNECNFLERNVSKLTDNVNKPNLNFRPKKPCTESQEQALDSVHRHNIFSSGNLDCQNSSGINLSTTAEISKKNTECNVKYAQSNDNSLFAQETDLENSQVESILEGLDASSFMSDDF